MKHIFAGSHPSPLCLALAWEEVSPWTTCTKSCGTGESSRTRVCRNDADGSGLEPWQCGGGDQAEKIKCNMPFCAGNMIVTSKHVYHP